MSITSKIDKSRQLITIIATGKISSNEIEDTVESFYKKQPSNNVLWDFRYADLEALLFSDELKNITTSLTKLNWKLKRVGKTAIVALKRSNEECRIESWLSYIKTDQQWHFHGCAIAVNVYTPYCFKPLIDCAQESIFNELESRNSLLILNCETQCEKWLNDGWRL